MSTNPTPQGLPAKICVIPPEPFSENELRQRWNAQADEWNSWDNLSLGEQFAWAQSCAIAADRAQRVEAPEALALIPEHDRQRIAALDPAISPAGRFAIDLSIPPASRLWPSRPTSPPCRPWGCPLLKPGETIAATDPANAILAMAADCTG